MSRGATLVYSNVRKVGQDLAARAPDYLVTVRRPLLACLTAGRLIERRAFSYSLQVPLVLGSMANRIEAAIQKQGGLRALLGAALVAGSNAWVRARRVLQGLDLRFALEPPSLLERVSAALLSLLLWPVWWLASRLVFSKAREQLGVRRAIISGGGSLPAHLDDLFESMSLPVLNGWGLTETSPVLSCRELGFGSPGGTSGHSNQASGLPWLPTGRFDWNPRLTVGEVIPGTTLRVVDPEDTSRELPPGSKGLLLARGPGVMQGYYGDPVATTGAFRLGGGWLDTGDLGMVVPRRPWHRLGGAVILSGRSKEVIVLSTGENVEPQPLEDACCSSPLVSQCMVVGQDQRHLGALVVVNQDHLETLARAQGRDGGFSPEEVEKMVYAAVDQAIRNKPGGYRPQEHISRIRIIPEPFSPENGALTRTMKLRRSVIETQLYREYVEELFNGR